LIFNSGGSEGNNTVIKSLWQIYKSTERNEFICSSVEHPSVMKTYAYLESLGARVHYIPVSKEGVLDLQFLREKLSRKTCLVSVMAANNETGTVFPLAQIAELAHVHGALLHSDSVQMFGKLPVDVKALGVDYATFSAHKFYSLKGCGFVYVKKGSPYEPLIHGGAQERHRRGGTENTMAIAALGFMAKHSHLVTHHQQGMSELRDSMEHKISQELGGVHFTARQTQRLPNTSAMVIEGVDGETLLMGLDLKGFCVSTGAACSSGNPEPSPVLLAMGLSREEAQSSLRVSLGWETTSEQVELFIQALVEVVTRIRSIRNEAVL